MEKVKIFTGLYKLQDEINKFLSSYKIEITRVFQTQSGDSGNVVITIFYRGIG